MPMLSVRDHLQYNCFHFTPLRWVPFCPAGWFANPQHTTLVTEGHSRLSRIMTETYWHMWRRPQTHLWDKLSSTVVDIKDGHEDKCRTHPLTASVSYVTLRGFEAGWRLHQFSSVALAINCPLRFFKLFMMTAPLFVHTLNQFHHYAMRRNGTILK